ncbi:MAG TPA: spore germination protein GerPE [Bacillales bacterium]|nr:spore germination protein GerPE [Bacillales bacterium]
MPKRLSLVDTVEVNSSVSSSVIQVGDSVKLTPRSKALAVQKEYPIYRSDEGDYTAFDVYAQKIPEVPFECNVKMSTYNEVPVIKVGNIRIMGIAASGMLHVGSAQSTDAESRVQHFRHFFFPPSEE